MLKVDVAELKRPIQTSPEYSFCGDATVVRDGPNDLFLAIFDASGHGYRAAKTAELAVKILNNSGRKTLKERILELHNVLKGTSGGVVGICYVDKIKNKLTYTGIGNITIRLFTPENSHLVIRDGTLGLEDINPIIQEIDLTPGNMLLLYTDGVSNVEPDNIPRFFELPAEQIARISIDYFSRILDDAAIIVLKVCHD